ncbi:thioredoxin family protein [Polaromonas sp. P1(28)-13]|nr:thioredoxin family protein [Polaromonas sp. P1(28)-13]
MTYEQALQCSQIAPGVVLLSSPTCAPCQAMKPVLARLACDLRFAVTMLDAADHKSVCMELGIRTVPTMLILGQGAVQAKITGAKTEVQLRDIIERHGITQGQLDV